MAISKVIYDYVVSEENYGDRAEIIQEGTKGRWAFLVLEGEVKVKKKTPMGWLTVDTLKKGAILGEMVLVTRGECIRTASVVAHGPVKIGVLDIDRIIKDFESLSPQLRTLLGVLITRLRESMNRLAVLVAKAAG